MGEGEGRATVDSFSIDLRSMAAAEEVRAEVCATVCHGHQILRNSYPLFEAMDFPWSPASPDPDQDEVGEERGRERGSEEEVYFFLCRFRCGEFRRIKQKQSLTQARSSSSPNAQGSRLAALTKPTCQFRVNLPDSS